MTNNAISKISTSEDKSHSMVVPDWLGIVISLLMLSVLASVYVSLG